MSLLLINDFYVQLKVLLRESEGEIYWDGIAAVNHFVIIKFLYGSLNRCCINVYSNRERRQSVWEMKYLDESVTLSHPPLKYISTSLCLFIHRCVERSFLYSTHTHNDSHKSHARVNFKDHFYCILRDKFNSETWIK